MPITIMPPPLRRATMASSSTTPESPKKKRQGTVVTPTPKKRRTSPRKSTKLSNKVASLTAVASLAAVATTSTAALPASSSNTKVIVNPNRPLFFKRTESFQAHTHNSTTPIHTLILGTHPSKKSLEFHQYFGHPVNAFWWIAGDCLGFRRAPGLKTNGEPLALTEHVRHGHDKIIPYKPQVETLTSHGFALWDVVKSCQRHQGSSLDAAIEKEEPNDIPGFCRQHPSIKRIVLANGSTGCTMFNKHFKQWWDSEELQAANDDFSQRAFGAKERQAKKKLLQKIKGQAKDDMTTAPITCICAIGVSPAAASYSYLQKRDFWEQHVYRPGLEDYKKSLKSCDDECN